MRNPPSSSATVQGQRPAAAPTKRGRGGRSREGREVEGGEEGDEGRRERTDWGGGRKAPEAVACRRGAGFPEAAGLLHPPLPSASQQPPVWLGLQPPLPLYPSHVTDGAPHPPQGPAVDPWSTGSLLLPPGQWRPFMRLPSPRAGHMGAWLAGPRAGDAPHSPPSVCWAVSSRWEALLGAQAPRPFCTFHLGSPWSPGSLRHPLFLAQASHPPGLQFVTSQPLPQMWASWGSDGPS